MAHPVGTSRRGLAEKFLNIPAVQPLWSDLVVQVPRLIVLLRALPAEDGPVVYLDELPLGAMAEVAKETEKAEELNIYRSYYITSMKV